MSATAIPLLGIGKILWDSLKGSLTKLFNGDFKGVFKDIIDSAGEIIYDIVASPYIFYIVLAVTITLHENNGFKLVPFSVAVLFGQYFIIYKVIEVLILKKSVSLSK